MTISPEDPRNSLEQSQLISERLALREQERVLDALRDDRVSLYYQPVVRSDAGNFIAFHEALARIHMPNGDVVPAGKFMPFVDNTNIGGMLDRRALSLALESLAATPDLRLSVNMSVYSMSSADWLSRLESSERSIRERLIVEITESGAMENVDATSLFLEKLRGLGVSLAIDDFGTGSTSFRYFREFKFDAVKIDGMFIRDIAHNKDYRVVVESLVKICHQFDMFTVAEFIETEEDAAVARELGVDCFQGYLIGKPTAVPTKVGECWSTSGQLAG